MSHQPQVSGLNPNASPFENPTKMSLYVGANDTTLLQTAHAHVYNPSKPDSTLKICVVLDTGSQRSYVTDRVKDVLHSEPEETQRVCIAQARVAHKVSRLYDWA